MYNQIPLKTTKKLTPLKPPTQTIQKHNPKHHNKNTNNKLTLATQTHLQNKYVKIPSNTHYQSKPTHKTTKTQKSITKHHLKTKLHYKHTNPNNKTQKTTHKINLKRTRPTGLVPNQIKLNNINNNTKI